MKHRGAIFWRRFAAAAALAVTAGCASGPMSRPPQRADLAGLGPANAGFVSVALLPTIVVRGDGTPERLAAIKDVEGEKILAAVERAYQSMNYSLCSRAEVRRVLGDRVVDPKQVTSEEMRELALRLGADVVAPTEIRLMVANSRFIATEIVMNAYDRKEGLLRRRITWVMKAGEKPAQPAAAPGDTGKP